MSGQGQTARESRQYEVVLNGKVLPGFTPDQALASLSKLFNTPAHELNKIFIGGEHPIDHLFSADEALAMQERLESIGLRASVVRATPDQPPLTLKQHSKIAGNAIERAAGDPSVAPYPEQAAPLPRRQAEITASPRPSGAPRHPTEPHAQQHWHNGWQDQLDEDAFKGPDQVALFVGPSNERYRSVFARFSRRGNLGIVLSWNWAAFISPFLWAMYRKMWLWGLVIGITEVILPMVALFMGMQGFVSQKLIYVGLLGIAANRVFWPAVVNYLYFRHVNGSLRRLHHLVTYVADVDIASSGGTSKTGVFVGVAFSAVSILFLWSVLDSIQPAQEAYDPVADFKSPSTLGMAENRNLQPLVVTQSRLQQLGKVLSSWAEQHGNVVISLRTLSIEEGLSDDLLADGWGEAIRLIRESAGYRLISAGPDQQFGTPDDVESFVRARSVAATAGQETADTIAAPTSPD